MRKLFRRKAAAIIAAIVAFAAIPAAGMIATASPALASTVRLCNAFGHGYCLGAPTVSNGNPVELTASGRDLNIVDQNWSFAGFEVYRLHFVADTSQCVGVVDSGSKVTIRNCSGGNDSNVNWTEIPRDNGSIWFYNITKDGWVYSDNALGDQLLVTGDQADCSGCYFGWLMR